MALGVLGAEVAVDDREGSSSPVDQAARRRLEELYQEIERQEAALREELHQEIERREATLQRLEKVREELATSIKEQAQRQELLADLESIRSKSQMYVLLRRLSSIGSSPGSVYNLGYVRARFAIHLSGPNRSFSERLQRWRGHQPGIDHGPGADWLALLEDQQNIHQDFAYAVVLVLAQERPDLLVKAAHNIFSDQSSGVDRSSRGYILLLMILSDAVRHAKQKTSDDDGRDGRHHEKGTG